MAGMRTRRIAAFAATVAAAVVLTTPAGATVVERGHYTEPISFSYNDCGFEVVVEGTASGHFRIRAGKGRTDTAFFLLDNFSYVETHTNANTGASLTIEGNGVFNEIKASPVEGNVFEFEAVEAGQPFTVYDADGSLVLRDRGSLHHHILFDTGGDDMPGGELLEDLGTEVHGPHPSFDSDFCEIVTSLIGS